MNYSLKPHPSRALWLEARRRALGGSDAPAVLGLSQYATPLSVWASKCDLEPPSDSTYSMRRGNHMESFIAHELATNVEGVTVEELFGSGDFVIASRDDEPHVAYSPDALLRDPDGVLVGGEWKSQLRGAKRWDEEVPLDVQAQAQHGMFVMGLPAFYVAVDLGHEMRWQRVERDPLYGERIVPALRKWWGDFVETETPPPATGRDIDSGVLAYLFPEDFGGSVLLPDGFAAEAERLVILEAEAKRLSGEIDEIKNRVKAAIGDATRGELADGSGWTWKTQRRKGYTVGPTEFRTLRRAAKRK